MRDAAMQTHADPMQMHTTHAAMQTHVDPTQIAAMQTHMDPTQMHTMHAAAQTHADPMQTNPTHDACHMEMQTCERTTSREIAIQMKDTVLPMCETTA